MTHSLIQPFKIRIDSTKNLEFPDFKYWNITIENNYCILSYNTNTLSITQSNEGNIELNKKAYTSYPSILELNIIFKILEEYCILNTLTIQNSENFCIEDFFGNESCLVIIKYNNSGTRIFTITIINNSSTSLKYEYIFSMYNNDYQILKYI